MANSNDGMVRCAEDGWKLIAMHDPMERRGLWYRIEGPDREIELCAGREGDDDYVTLAYLPLLVKRALEDVLQTARFAFEEGVTGELEHRLGEILGDNECHWEQECKRLRAELARLGDGQG